MTFRIHRSDFGAPSSFLFLVITTFNVPFSLEGASDVAPNGHLVLFDHARVAAQPAVPRPTPPPPATTVPLPNPGLGRTHRGRDRQGRTGSLPVCARSRASAGGGGIVRLRYTVFDLSGKTREEVRIYGRRLIAVKRAALAETQGGQVYFVRWQVPRKASRLRFCVRAWDAAGNRSAPSCAALRVR